MWTDSDLQELLSFHPEHPVLSLFLNLDPSQVNPEAQRLHLRELLKPLEQESPQDVQAVLDYFDSQGSALGKGAAFFSCQPEGYFRVHSFAIPFRSRARILSRPYLKPIAHLLDSYGHFGLALIDQQSARFIHLHLGEPRQETVWDGEPVRHTKSGGGSQASGRRGGRSDQTGSSQETAERNLRQAAQRAAKFFKQHDIRRVILGGSEANISFFQAALPKVWQSLVIGSFPVDMNTAVNEITEKALQVARQAEHEREQALVERLVTIAAKGGEAVLTLDETLEAVHAGRVQRLVLAEGFRQAGYRCQGCDYLTVQELAECPFCGNSFEQIKDAVEFAVRRVLENGGEVEVISQGSDLEAAGRIGGLLRY